MRIDLKKSKCRRTSRARQTPFATVVGLTIGFTLGWPLPADAHALRQGKLSRNELAAEIDELVDRAEDAYAAALTFAAGFTKRAPQAVVPIVLMALNYQIGGHVPRHSIPFMCEQNPKVVVLTNVKQNSLPNADCLEVVNVGSSYQSSIAEMPWPAKAPGNQKVYFNRWYVLRDWMARTNTSQVFTMDSDAMMTLNITEFVSLNVLELSNHDMWIVYNPPRSSWPFALLTGRALKDITSFWNRMFQPDIWTSEFTGGTAPNDIIALGHYSHTAIGKPYPCWGYGADHALGTCDDSIAYGHAKVLDRLRKKGVRAKYPPGTLTLGAGGAARFVEGVVDNNYRHDPIQRYEMQKGKYKQLRFWRGQPQLKLRSQRWTSVWGYILEDETEACMKHHVEHIHKARSCRCENWCCNKCPSEDTSDDNLTVWSLWRNDTRDLLVPHLRFYMEYWKAERLFLNIGYDVEGELLYATQTLDKLCGTVQKSRPMHEKLLSGATLTQWRCTAGQEINVLSYESGDPDRSQWGPLKGKLMSFYRKHHDETVKKMHVDCDEFFVPAFGDVASARKLNDFNYHMVMIKPHVGKRKWSKKFEWVDQPYYYRLRAIYAKQKYPHDNWDGNEPLLKLDRMSHSGPFKEHDVLRRSAKESPEEYRNALYTTHTMFHMSVPSEEMFETQKWFDQTTTNGARKEEDTKQHFKTFFLSPEKDFVVFEDNYLHRYFQYHSRRTDL